MRYASKKCKRMRAWHSSSIELRCRQNIIGRSAMKLRWLGHAAFRVETAKDTILIDPFLTYNPAFQGQDIKDVTKGVTHILLTHGHMDHVGDTIALANELGAVVVANADLGDWLGFRGV